MSRIKTAVFPVAGLGTRFLPATKAIPKEMLTVVDRPLIHYAVDEAKSAGIERFIFITSQGKSAIEDHFDRSHILEKTLIERGKHDVLATLASCHIDTGHSIFIRQQEPLGLGHAVLCAQHFVGNEPFALILADDLILSPRPCLLQMSQAYHRGNMAAVMTVETDEVSLYGIMDVQDKTGPIVSARSVVEKPHITDAPSCTAIIGRYILDPGIFSVLTNQRPGKGGEIQLTDALSTMLPHTPLTGYEFEGTRFDCGTRSGWLAANITYALQDVELKSMVQTVLKNLIV